MKVQLVLAWYDIWVGFYWDRKNKVLYVMPIPCIGFKVAFRCRTKINGWKGLEE